MVPWLLLAALGALLAVVGLVAVFKVGGEGENSFKLAGLVEIKSRTTGAFLVAIGAALGLVGVQQGTKTETRVIDAQLKTDFGSDSVEYNVRCPISVALVGSISVSGDPGTVSFRLDRQDGLDAPVTQGRVQTVAFDEPGTKEISFNIPVTIPEGRVYFETRLVVIDPTTVESSPVQATVTCDPSLPPGPAEPPPEVPAPNS